MPGCCGNEGGEGLRFEGGAVRRGDAPRAVLQNWYKPSPIKRPHTYLQVIVSTSMKWVLRGECL
jgi:hypothetical protein